MVHVERKCKNLKLPKAPPKKKKKKKKKIEKKKSSGIALNTFV